ncbi:uncharacterized protein CG13380 [Drosophila ficusphila]|uniref:uncharacterized protein CG13380 n=1 Tax=Drosophila ficusphila TaxID=30025 RepID=UPI0007E83D6F|nr:uncharacterized protein CG13380 [Drosophila ficusphila]
MSFEKFETNGTDPCSIAARLRERYGNLSAPSIKDVTIIKKPSSKSFKSFPLTELEAEQQEYLQFKEDLYRSVSLNREINIQIQSEERLKLKNDMSENHGSTRICICQRAPTAYECDRCHQYFYGRISEICEKHPHELFLMDLRGCPCCMAPIQLIKKAPISWEAIRKFEDGDLPSDDDL